MTGSDAGTIAERLEQLCRKAPVIFWVGELSEPYRTKATSPALQDLLGFTRDECTTRDSFWIDRVHPEDRASLIALLGRIGERGRDTIECRVAHRDGSYRRLRGTFVLTHAPNGRRGEVAGIFSDFTNRHPGAAANRPTGARRDSSDGEPEPAGTDLRASEQRYRDLFENANDILFTTDLELNFTSLNAAGELATGYSREQALRMKATSVVPPESAELIRSRLRNMLDGVPVPMLETDVITADGRRIPLEVNTRLLYRDGRPVGVQGIARDISERRALETQIREAQKLEALGRLAGGIAHDFNNLLTVILACCEDLEDRIGPAASAESVETIRKTTERAAALTRQLLGFGRRHKVTRRPVNLNAVIAGICRMVERIIGEDVQLVTELAPNLHDIHADPGQVEQVIMNLVVNARDAMPHGGRLVISTSNFDPATSGSRRPAVDAGPHVLLTVQDTGAGMDVETEARIFEPFFSTKSASKGSGLGLSTVYGIVKDHGGSIRVQTQPGAGTAFRLAFPAINTESARTSDVKRDDVDAPLRRRTGNR